MVGAGTDEERAGRLIGAPEVHDTGAAARRRCGQTAREIVDEARGEVGWIGVCEEPGSLKPERQRVAQSQQVVLGGAEECLLGRRRRNYANEKQRDQEPSITSTHVPFLPLFRQAREFPSPPG